MTARLANRLLDSGLPIFFAAGSPEDLGLRLPADRHGQSIRVWARSLSVMQKEAIVASVRSGRAWRLASDEGPYLDGADSAPCPLSFMSTGMVASYMNEILALARQRAVPIRDLSLVQDNYYTMEGSALRGTMTGGALPVSLDARIDSDADDETLGDLLSAAVRASPLDGLLRKALPSLFTLTHNGTQIDTGRVASARAPLVDDPAEELRRAAPRGGSGDAELVGRLRAVEAQHGVAGGAGSSLKASQSRQLHLRVTCTLRPDGVKEIVQELYSPLGSTFRFLSDEAEEAGGRGAAPDAMSYASAGIAFCFMTQLGRYAKIMKKDLDAYNVVQDIHFSLGGAGGPGVADAVETHTHLRTAEDPDFARAALDMGEQTCFLHALCRSALETRVTLTRVPSA